MVKLTVLHTNDIHGRVQPLLRIATLVRQIRAEVESSGGYCLYLDAGDSEDTSNLESSLTKGSAMEAILRGAGCDYVALGNAIPIRYGAEAIENLAVHFGRPLLCGNMFDQHGKLLPGLVPYEILSLGSIKVGLLGLTDPMPAYRVFFKLDARKPADVLPGLMDEARSYGAKFLILLSHLSSNTDRQLATDVPGLDLIIGGHDHQVLYPPLEIYGTVIAQAGEHGKILGRLDIEIDEETGKIIRYKGELIPVDETIPEDEHAQAVVESERARVERMMLTPVGFLERTVEYAEDKECSAGNLLADALLDRMEGTQVALVLAGHWNTGLEAGQVTQGQIFAANRSTANPARVALRGEQIKSFLCESLKLENATRRLHSLRGGAVGMPHVAGARVRYDPNAPDSLEIEVQGQPLLDDKTYLVAATDFEFSGQLQYLTVPTEEIEYEVPTIMPEVLEDYIRRNSPMQALLTNRIISRTVT